MSIPEKPLQSVLYILLLALDLMTLFQILEVLHVFAYELQRLDVVALLLHFIDYYLLLLCRQIVQRAGYLVFELSEAISALWIGLAFGAVVGAS